MSPVFQSTRALTCIAIFVIKPGESSFCFGALDGAPDAAYNGVWMTGFGLIFMSAFNRSRAIVISSRENEKESTQGPVGFQRVAS